MNSTPAGQPHDSKRPDSPASTRPGTARDELTADVVTGINRHGGAVAQAFGGWLPVVRALKWVGTAALLYLALAYFTLPSLWELIEPRHVAIDALPRHAETHSRIPGDPLNLGIVGTEDEMLRAFVAAGWFPADEVTLRSSLRIIEDTLLHHTYRHAPISPLYCFGRVQDLAFEKPVGHSPRQRHHVRFWKSDLPSADGRPFWAGAAIFDIGVELSKTTGQVTHRTDGHIDVERDLLANDLDAAGRLQSRRYQPGFHRQRTGRNGGGDQWSTDGRLCVLVLNPESSGESSARAPRDSAERSSRPRAEKPVDREAAETPSEPR
jgi:hypothetical protein